MNTQNNTPESVVSQKNTTPETQVTDAVIKKLSDEKEGLVFILWWAFAQQKEALIDKDKHFIIKSAHPSPFSADRGFFWSRPFSTCNEMLESIGKEPIDWDLNH